MPSNSHQDILGLVQPQRGFCPITLKHGLQIPYDITYMWNLKYNTNISMNEKQTHREQICGCHQGSRTGGEKDWESGINRRKLAQTGWINKTLLYSTGNYIQYPEINHNGKEYKKEYIYICVCVYITESLCYTAEIKCNIVSQLYFNNFLLKNKNAFLDLSPPQGG